ncbi:MAG TPA: amidase family protein, partial [Ohtaekwangia sp.]|nr:amidase family protein [Ohtaekwangia sp.]
MLRRTFFQRTGLASLALLPGVSGLQSCQPKQKTETESEKEFLLAEATIDELQKKMEAGELTSRQITQHYLDRIREIDRGGPMLNSVIEINPDALAIAEERDHERKENKVRGPLHGIPVLIKDNIDTGDKMMTTAGSLALEGHVAEKDAHIIRLLREAGAVLLGKTN